MTWTFTDHDGKTYTPDPAPRQTFTVGDIVRTRTGKNECVVVEVRTPDSLGATVRRLGVIQNTGSGMLPYLHYRVQYRTLRNGKPFGPERGAHPDTLRHAEVID